MRTAQRHRLVQIRVHAAAAALVASIASMHILLAAESSVYYPNKITIEQPQERKKNSDHYQQIIQGKSFWIFPPVTQATTETAQFLQYMHIGKR